MTQYKDGLETFRRLPKLRLLAGPTPIEPCDRLRAALPPGAPRLFIKRDDYTSYFVGGNKIRKLEYSLAEAVRRKATAVVTIGSSRSNHARITAMAARRLGLKCSLVLNGNSDETPSGNLLIIKLLDVDIIPVATRDERMPKMDEIAAKLESRGERVYKIPLGASDEVGSFGLSAAFEEVAAQESELGLRFDRIVLSSSSGGTQAGLEIGKRLFGRSKLGILGVSPDDPAASIRATVIDVAVKMAARIGGSGLPIPEEIVVDDAYVGAGYGLLTPAAVEAAELFARTEGILLDSVYTNKAAAALIDYARNGRFDRDENILFWHTGGLIGLFG